MIRQLFFSDTRQSDAASPEGITSHLFVFPDAGVDSDHLLPNPQSRDWKGVVPLSELSSVISVQYFIVSRL